MKTYEKPLILASEEIAEGVYTASGSTSGSSKCKSKYMKGVFQGNTRSQHIVDPGNDSDTMHKEIERGCEGCPYNWGYCAVNSSNSQAGQNARPGWEQKGYKDTDPYSYGA